jgi:hypothetical protein
MPNVFDYQFNVGGNFTAAMDGMAENNYRIQKKSGLPLPQRVTHTSRVNVCDTTPDYRFV